MLVSGRITFGGRGAPAGVFVAWFEGRFEMVLSEELLNELARVLLRPKFRRYITEEEVGEYVRLLRRTVILEPEPVAPPQEALTPDPKDDYLVVLARSSRAHFLISGDPHITKLSDPLPPVLAPRAFLDILKVQN